MASEITVVELRPLKRGETLQGFLTLTMMESGLVLRDCRLHQRDGARWVGLPVRRYTKDGETAWARVVDFIDKQSYQRFQKGALAAVDRYFRAQSAESETVTKADEDWATLGGKR